MKRVSPFIPEQTRKTLFNTLVLPHYDYCSNIWSCISMTQIQRLQRIQNRALRIILQCDYRSHVLPMLHQLNVMSVSQRFLYNKCVLMWRILHGTVPSHVSEDFTLESERPRDTRQTRFMSDMNLHLTMDHRRSLKYLMHGTIFLKILKLKKD